MVQLFLNRPILAVTSSLFILLIGVVSIPFLPVAEYPTIVPPIVTVEANYVGANASAVEAAVTTPIEQALIGTPGLQYFSSESGADGLATITCTFDQGYNVNVASNDVQSAINRIQGRLPNDVIQQGISVSKLSGSQVLLINFASSHASWNKQYITSLLENTINPELRQIPGVAAIVFYGERRYAMRIWLDPRRLAKNGLVVDDVLDALTQQNIQIGGGAFGAPPTTGHQLYEYSARIAGRLHDASDFEHVLLKSTADGRFVRLSDVARVTLGAENYSQDLRSDGKPSVAIGIQQLSTGNEIEISRDVRAVLNRVKTSFPPGLSYSIVSDRAEYVNLAMSEVETTLLMTLLLVVLVVYVSFGHWKTTVIPLVSIPVSLLGTFGLLKLLGFSINTLTLFGLTLAAGLVVDDAIVILDNIKRYQRDYNASLSVAVSGAMSGITGAVVASSVSLLAVFVPVAFFPGTTGLLYREFAWTVAAAILISLFNALTLTPFLTSLLLDGAPSEPSHFGKHIFSKVERAYERSLQLSVNVWSVLLCFYVAAFALACWLFVRLPSGFVPAEDRGIILVDFQARQGFSVDQAERLQDTVVRLIRKDSDVDSVLVDGGYGSSTAAELFVRLKPFLQRRGDAHSSRTIIRRLNSEFAKVGDARVFAVGQPSIPGLGRKGGFAFELEDRSGHDLHSLQDKAQALIMATKSHVSAIGDVSTGFAFDKPTVVISIKREKAIHVGVPLSSLFDTLQTYLGSIYVNDFSMNGRLYRVFVQADTAYRSKVSDLETAYVRPANATAVKGDASQSTQIPVASLVSLANVIDPTIITHFNGFRSVEITGSTNPGFSTGQAISEMNHFGSKLPDGFGYEWSGIAREESKGAAQFLLIFASGILVVFLALAFQYRSFSDPLIIVFAVPIAILGASAALTVTGGISDIFAQVGYVMLIGLASKNAIIVVDFANALRSRGLSVESAVITASLARFRPIMMTSVAFIVGISPFLFAGGAGANARHSLGLVILGGMIVSTALNLFFTPIIYVAFAKILSKGALGACRS